MTKDSRVQATSADRTRASRKLSCILSRFKQTPSKSKVPPKREEDAKEWEEARCPVCLEHPHNAVLLICSSHEKGCRPFMCDTSYRHSNCLDQFCKSAAASAEETVEASLRVDHGFIEAISELTVTEVIESERYGTSVPISFNNEAQAQLLCPLCRGYIIKWVVMEPARHFMNSKSRNCACETCDYSGSYTDLRKHARVEHPLVRPSLVDPERRQNWRRMERQRDMGDLLSTLRSSWEERDDEADGNETSVGGYWGLLRAFLVLIRVFHLTADSSHSSSWTGTTTYSARAHVTARRRSVMLWGEGFNGGTVRSLAIERESEPTSDRTEIP